MEQNQHYEQRGAQEIQETTLSWRNALIATLLTALEKWANLYVKRIDTKDSIEATKPEFNLFLKEFTLLFMISKKLLPDTLVKEILVYLGSLNHLTVESRQKSMDFTMEIQHHLEEKGIVPLVLTLPQPAFVLEALGRETKATPPETQPKNNPPPPPPTPRPRVPLFEDIPVIEDL